MSDRLFEIAYRMTILDNSPLSEILAPVLEDMSWLVYEVNTLRAELAKAGGQ